MIRLFFTKFWSVTSIRRYTRRVNLIATDPGITRRKHLLKADKEIESLDFDDLETDFTNMSDVYDEHTAEMAVAKEKLKYRIVKKKYFDEKDPNFLFWNEKEQIRHLHQTNEDWSLDRLSDSFPALPDTISKIIKSKWRPKNDNRIKNHDGGVLKNWQLFKNGKLENLPKNLERHLKKFVNRPDNIPKEAYGSHTDSEKSVITVTTGKSEFRAIISNYVDQLKQISDGQNQETNTKISTNKQIFNKRIGDDSDSTFILQKKSAISHREVTLDQLRQNLLSNQHNLRNNDAQFLRNLCEKTQQQNSISGSSSLSDELRNDIVENVSAKCTPSLSVSYDTPRIFAYPNRIRIPSGKFKKGATYKVNDCFYDDDGQFLYRVPGLCS